MIEEAAKGDGPTSEDGTDDTGTSVMAEGVIIWREEVLIFFVIVASSSINLRLLPTGGEDIAATSAARRRHDGV